MRLCACIEVHKISVKRIANSVHTYICMYVTINLSHVVISSTYLHVKMDAKNIQTELKETYQELSAFF